MKRKSLLLMMLLALFSSGAWAQFSGGSGSESDPYLISTSSDWSSLASKVNGGTNYSGKYFKLTSNITISGSTQNYMVGTMSGETSSGYAFSGNFNGDGHTITISYSTNSSFYYTAPFRYISGATIKNVRVAGTMNVYKFMGSLVGYCMGTNNIENCVSEVAITGTISGDATMGGLISHVHGGDTYIRGCVFKGKLLGSSSYCVGGFIGWTDHGSADSYFYDCVFAPSQVTVGTTNSATFSRGNNTNSSGIHVYNSFYTQTINTTQGSKLQYTITAGSNVSTVALGNNPVEYNLSGITGYNSSSGYGIKYNNTIYAASGNSVKLNLSSTLTNPQYSASAGSLSGTSNPYTLSMTSSNTVISATDGGSGGGGGDGNCAEIGTGTSTTGYAPLKGNYKGSYAQMIYTASQLQDAGITQGSIIKIGFNSSASNSLSRKPVIYMGTTSKSSFSSDSDFIDINSLTKVYDYNNNHSQWSITSDWNEFELDTPFDYDGQSNIVIAVHCGWISNYEGTSFYYTSNSDHVICAYSDDQSKDPIPATYNNNWSNYSGYKNKNGELPNLRLYYHENLEEISIGDDASTGSGYYLPVNMYYKNSMTQQIFTADEIGTAGTIKSISFNCTAIGNSTTTKTVKVYMKHTDKETFSSSTDVVRMDAADEVIASFTLLPTATGWVKMTLDTPFEYDGQSNLLICCYDHSYQYPGSSYKFQTTATTGYTSITYYSDSDYNYDPTGTPSTSGNEAYNQYRNNLKMGIVPAAVSHPLTIATVEDWNAFCAAVNGGYDYSGETVTMTANVGTESDPVTTMCGTESNPFRGTFDGQGNTLTVNISSSNAGAAPFHYISNATIENLKVAGTVSSSANHGSGLVGFAWDGTNHIENCLVSTTVTGEAGYGLCGGIIGHGRSATNYITGCVFNGTIDVSHNDTQRGIGGLLGWSDSSTLYIENSLFAGTKTSNGTQRFHPMGCKDGSKTTTGSITNSYYITNVTILGDSDSYSITSSTSLNGKGKYAYTITGQTPVNVANAGTATNYSVSGITSYSTGIKYNNVLYAGSGDQVSLTLDGANSYVADNGTLAESGNAYTLTMAASNTIISGISCAVPTNLQCTYYNRTSATLAWTAGGDEEAWQVKCWPSNQQEPGDLDGYTTNVSTNPYTLTNLTQGQTYYVKVRAKCDENNFSDWSNTITVTPQALTYEFTNADATPNNANWDELTNWQYSDPDITVTTLPTINDNVLIKAACTIPNDCLAQANEITLYTDAGNVYGSITIENGGQLWHSNEGVVVTIERVIPAYLQENEGTNLGYKIISFPPVSGIAPRSEFIEGLLTPNNPYDFYTFNYNNQEQNVYLEWVHVNVSNDDLLYPNMGFLYASQNGTTISVTGDVAPSFEDYTYDLTLNSDGGDAPFFGWQLVGNPFVCNAYLTENDNLDFYVIQENDEYAEFYPITPSVEIPPMGGVMVWLHADDNLVYSRTAPSKGPGILNMDVNKASMRGTTMLDRARVRFGEGRNLKKLQLNPRHTKLYIPEDGNDFSVYYAEGAGTIPVNFKAQDNGRYTLDFSTEDVGFNYLHLIDNMNGNDVDLLQTPYYTFDAKSTDFASRFTLVFATGNDNDDTFAFFNNGVWIINNPSTDSGAEATLQVVDVLGHILSSETISGSCSKAINVAPGVYMLRIINGNDVKVQKIVVRR